MPKRTRSASARASGATQGATKKKTRPTRRATSSTLKAVRAAPVDAAPVPAAATVVAVAKSTTINHQSPTTPIPIPTLIPTTTATSATTTPPTSPPATALATVVPGTSVMMVPLQQQQQAASQLQRQPKHKTVAMSWIDETRAKARAANTMSLGLPLADYSALQLAALQGKIRVLRWVYNQGSVDLEERDALGRTALHLACAMGQMRGAQTLIQLGADINAETYRKETPFLLACGAGEDRVVEELLLLGSDIAATDVEGQTAAFAAAKRGHIKVLRLLQTHDGDLTTPSDTNVTPLMVAQAAGYPGIVRFFDSLGITPDTPVASEQTKYEAEAEGMSHLWEWFALPDSHVPELPLPALPVEAFQPVFAY
eukprot:g5028.t1